MTIESIICVILGGIILIVGVVIGILRFVDGEAFAGITAIVVGILLAASFIVPAIVYSGTEAGKRALKDQKSNFGDGINRTVTVYDVNGELIRKYSGKFDVETTSEYIIFDDEKDKRHMIYYKTGTVIIDEN